MLRVGRPVLAIVGNAPRLDFKDSESAVWRARLQASAPLLQRAAQAVGRIEVTGLPGFPFVGTGWLVDKNIVVTNRHVAQAFAAADAAPASRSSRRAVPEPMTAAIDFLEETGRPTQLEFPIVEILHIEDEPGPDFALLRVETPIRAAHARVADPAGRARRAKPEQQVAVIGYPARDSRVPDAQLMQSIFGDVYDKKRLAPGQITKARKDLVFHDCSTLGGNSGSVVLDLATGRGGRAALRRPLSRSELRGAGGGRGGASRTGAASQAGPAAGQPAHECRRQTSAPRPTSAAPAAVRN